VKLETLKVTFTGCKLYTHLLYENLAKLSFFQKSKILFKPTITLKTELTLYKTTNNNRQQQQQKQQ